MAKPDIDSARRSVQRALERPNDLDAVTLTKMFGDGLSMKFSAGAYVVRFAGLGGSSTMGWRWALESWLRAANKRLEMETTDADL